ncbi:probable plastid-lipid-associated protein 12, chloroplastic isoform X8 [Miscanthus floridulus]|uniref:probable plastid-lipid-associated protein 12, chloroplastic isoform X8 n=1 Tax=Miscanthus floridulus TaxID=154761 RepID=UPI00345AD0D1
MLETKHCTDLVQKQLLRMESAYFRFDRAAFAFKFLPFKVPYPVPFRLLGDEAKGWLDTTYLSHTGNIRISRRNKGTTFVLQKSAEPRQILLSAISARTGVEEVINDFISSQNGTKTDLSILVGEWQLLWSSQTEGESWSSVASAVLKDFQQKREWQHLYRVHERSCSSWWFAVSLGCSRRICHGDIASISTTR